MKVPLLEGQTPETRPLPTPYQQTDAKGAFGGDLAQGVDKLEAASEDLGKKMQAEQAKADDTVVAEGLAKSQDKLNKRLAGDQQAQDPTTPREAAEQAFNDTPTQEGFLQTRGQAALAASGDLYDSMDSDRQAIADGMANDRQRKLYLQKSAGLYESAKRQAENHVGTQVERANEATDQALAATSLQGIANSYTDQDAIGTLSSVVEPRLRQRQLSPQDGDAKVQAWHAEVDKTRLDQYLEAKDYDGAQKLFEADDGAVKQQLGVHAPQFSKRIDALKQEVVSSQLAKQFMGAAVDDNGKVDDGHAYAEWDKLPQDTPSQVSLKNAALEALKVRLGINKQIDADTEKQSLGRVYQGIEKSGGHIDESSADYQQLSDWGKAQALEHAKATQRSGVVSDAAARREQAENNKIAVNAFNQLPIDDQINATVGQGYPGAAGADKATNLFISGLQKKAAALQQRGMAPSLTEFDQTVKSTAKQMGMDPKQSGADLVSHMVEWRSQWLDEHKGTPPSRKDVQAELKDTLLYGDKQGGEGWFDHDQYKFQAQKKGEAFKPFAAKEQKYAPNRNPVAAPEKVRVTGPGGISGKVPAAGLDEWLTKHKGWSRQ